MGEALLSGLLRAGFEKDRVLATVRRRERGEALAERYGVRVVSNVEAAKTAGTLILTVKPQDMARLLDEIGPHVPADTLVISAAAGITTSFVESRLGGQVPVVRVMSNTPVLVDEAMSVISAGAHAEEKHLRRVEELFSPVGKVLRIPESLQDAATALSGSGPAYFFYLVEAMVDAGILLGMPRAAALEMVIQSIVGAAIMLRDSGEHPVILREAVTSPGGTTIAAVASSTRQFHTGRSTGHAHTSALATVPTTAPTPPPTARPSNGEPTDQPTNPPSPTPATVSSQNHTRPRRRRARSRSASASASHTATGGSDALP